MSNVSGASDDVGKNRTVPIRKFYIYTIKENITEDDIKNDFEKFQDVESVEIHCNFSFKSAFVQFKNAVPKFEFHLWSMDRKFHSSRILRDVNVRAAHLSFQPDFQRDTLGPLSVAPDRNSPSNILIAIVDDCLHEIFEYLNVTDLVNVAETCVRFNQLAKETFARKYKYFDILYITDSNTNGPLNSDTVKCLLFNFGSSIQSFVVDRRSVQPEADYLIHLISKYCTKEQQLKQLKLSHFTMYPAMSKKLQTLFKTLDVLHLSFCHFMGDMETLLTTSDELKVLRVEHCKYDKWSVQSEYRKLAELVYYSQSLNVYDERSLQQFLTLHSSLLKLSVNVGHMNDYLKMSRLITEGLPELLELEFKVRSIQNGFFQNLGRFNSLKVIKFSLAGQSARELLKNLVENKTAIEHLELAKATIDDECIEYISQMKLLKIIGLSFTQPQLTDIHVNKWALDLPQLEEFHLNEPYNNRDTNSSFKITTVGLKNMLLHAHNLKLIQLNPVYGVSIDIGDYMAMLEIVKRRPKTVRLLIDVNSDGIIVNVPDETLTANREALYINEHAEYNPSIADSDIDYSDFDCFLNYDYD